MRGFTTDGFVRIQRTVLRRVVGDRLQALLRGDFYVRNQLGEEDYEPLVREIEALNVPATPFVGGGENNGASGGGGGGGVGESSHGGEGQKAQSPPSPPPQITFTPSLETFISLIASSIMIDASMRGENAGESDTRFIKKKKKLLAKTLAGPKLVDFQKEVLRFDRMKRGEEFSEEDIVESEESKSDESEEEEESEEEFESYKKKARKYSKQGLSSSSAAAHHAHGAHTHLPPPPRQSSDVESSSEASDAEVDSTLSDSGATSSLNSRSTLDGFSTSATSSKNKKKKDIKKRLKKERKKHKKEERRRLKKERKKKEKEELRKQRKKRRLMEKKKGKSVDNKQAKKRKKMHHGEENAVFADNELSDAGDANDSVDMERTHLHHPANHRNTNNDDEAPVYEMATKSDFENYKSTILSKVPKAVKCRFRQGGFSRWGKDWLPILELGPFDVEPGPVRDMWLDMFDNTQENGRDMTRLVFWYGVKYEDRSQAYSFVPSTKITPYEEGEQNGYTRMPKKIQKKVEKKQKLTKTEEQIKRGLKEIMADMEREEGDRAAWMMQFQEDYELAEEDAAKEEADQKLKLASVGEEVDGDRDENEIVVPVAIPKKRKPGRPKKEESVAAAVGKDKPIKRKPGRPKKVVVDVPPPQEEEELVVKVKKKGPGRPKKTDKEKAERVAEKAAEKAKAKKAAKKQKQSNAKKWLIVDEDHELEMETEDDDEDNDYDDLANSGDDGDMDVDTDGDEDSDAGDKSSGKKRKAKSTSPEKKPKKKKSKVPMTEEEKTIERRVKAAEYREKKARERAEAQGLEYVKGRVGRKSKETMREEEQMKFTKCEEVFLPMIKRLKEAKDDTTKVKGVLKCINSIMERVELLTPPFLLCYPLGMLVKTVRKSFEGAHPEVKDRCKRLTAEMKRVYTEKETKIPDDFEPVKNLKNAPTNVKQESAAASVVPDLVKLEKVTVKPENVVLKPEKVATKTEKAAIKLEKVDIPMEQLIPKRNSEMSLSEAMPRKLAGAISSECLPDAAKSEPAQPKQKKMFSIKGMFEKPKPAPKPKIAVPTPSMVVFGQPSPKPKSLPSWVIGPAMKMDDFHEQHAKERTFGLEFLVDAASQVTSSKKFDPVSVSQSFELAIFAETKLRGRDWHQYWEKVHDVVAMLSPGKNKRNAILQGIISGDYQEPSELVKLSRREIQSLNQLKS